jgi:hypothetical protein
MTAITEGHAWERPDLSDPTLVASLHRRVGEALTAAHARHEEAGHGRLDPGDERALARKPRWRHRIRRDRFGP